MKSPRNTAAEAAGNPLFGLVAAMNIEGQEAQGQREFVASEVLPTEIPPDDKAALEAAGVVFLGPVEGDPLFQFVTLPPGWRKERTDHSMWSDLKDNKGRKRAGIFYKAAFYDRKASANVVPRFSVSREYPTKGDYDTYSVTVLDAGVELFRTEPRTRPECKTKEEWAAEDAAEAAHQKIATDWLEERYQQWRDKRAYWDAP
jgi:hypothetical protein